MKIGLKKDHNGKRIKKVITDKINKSVWWHVPPQNPDAYRKRGKFLASTYKQAEFYGRPNDAPERISIKNPVYGFSEMEILKKLFPSDYKNKLLSEDSEIPNWYKQRIALDAAMFRKAKTLGHDAIVLFGLAGRKFLEKNRKPSSVELNLLYP